MHVPSVDYRRKLAVMLNIHYYYNRFFACYTLNYVLPLLLTKRSHAGIVFTQ